jgi:hypothetical protein
VKPIPHGGKSSSAVLTPNGGTRRITRDRSSRSSTGSWVAAVEIETELGRLEALHMEEWSARFSHALNLDLIGPDEF